MSNGPARRPLTTRSAGWANALARALVGSTITPNQISVISILFALVGAALLIYWPTPPGFVLAALCVQLRLLCNLLDGMVAIEGGKQSPLGALYNEFPDRIADSLFLIALGHAAGHGWLGWLMALLAALTAYIRVTGGSLGLAQDFRGPQAKPHRMAVMTAALLIGAVESWLRGSVWTLLGASVLIAAGTVLTCVLRSRAIAVQLRERG
ncbi:CDP-alcohol phosphatidyltransferase family protein [Xanthomonadaceae bacterium JHOS43]|nr:CDP-alcohol phosphatidyltransferase family protein [Xanthomonadaceae bacterium JHOS43]MCX7562196.1 CDP-alcohol phosphatidyltransferase family protein [Xanthomonadaceae bacterium XH05]